MQLLKKVIAAKRERMEKRRQQLLAATQDALRSLLPDQRAVVFGSLTRAGKFHENSDIDIALFDPPLEGTEYGLQAMLEEKLHRRVDVVMLPHCRFRDKILKEGLLWTS